MSDRPLTPNTPKGSALARFAHGAETPVQAIVGYFVGSAHYVSELQRYYPILTPPPFDASVLREEGFSGFVRRGASCLGYCVAQLLYSADVFSHRGWSYNLKWTFRVLLRIVLPFAVLGLLISLMSWLIVLLGDILTGVIGTVLWVLLWALPLMAGIAVAVLAARFFLWVTKRETVPRWVAYFTERRRAAK